MPIERNRAARALFDVNVLIALLDRDHVSHAAATAWYRAHAEYGWASCPITENGTARLMSSPGYPNPVPVAEVVSRLGKAARSGPHEFWPDDVSLLDASAFDRQAILGPKQITDRYLIALAVKHRGRLGTFDQGIRPTGVRGASDEHIMQLRG
ncbi:MAG TPA: TA system VapC family ribonuclease toxin [Rhizomicrobium sp.]|nr:TA system VapC family ribonuclease toxin [Rhizomicrobium sp.]